MLPWLTKRFLEAGGQVRKRKIHTLRELIDDGYDLIINCSGFGARELVDDNAVISIRGQVARVGNRVTESGVTAVLKFVK